MALDILALALALLVLFDIARRSGRYVGLLLFVLATRKR